MKRGETTKSGRHDPPASTAAARDAQIAAKAWRLLEQRLDDGTATASEVIEALRRSSEREALELRQREADIALKEAKINAINSATEIKELFEDAMTMFKRYHGDEDDAADLH